MKYSYMKLQEKGKDELLLGYGDELTVNDLVTEMNRC